MNTNEGNGECFSLIQTVVQGKKTKSLFYVANMGPILVAMVRMYTEPKF